MRRGFALLLIIFLIVSIGVFGIVYYKFQVKPPSIDHINGLIKRPSTNASVKKTSPQNSPIPKPISFVTTSTENYTNQKLKFSVKLPPNWEIIEEYSEIDNRAEVYIRNQVFNSAESKQKPRYPGSGYPKDYLYFRVFSPLTSK